jgi:hypothetical protein
MTIKLFKSITKAQKVRRWRKYYFIKKNIPKKIEELT